MRIDDIVEQRIVRNPSKLESSVPTQAHLYHGTPMSHLGLIIQSNRLDQGGYWHKPGEPHGVRCTRSLKAAKTFAFEQDFPGGILVMSWPKLAQRYKSIPHRDTQYNDDDPSQPGKAWGQDEAEEVILARMVKPLSEFLEAVLMRKKEYKELQAGKYLADEWTGNYAEYDGRPLHVHRRAIQTLMAYPNIKII